MQYTVYTTLYTLWLYVATIKLHQLSNPVLQLVALLLPHVHWCILLLMVVTMGHVFAVIRNVRLGC